MTISFSDFKQVSWYPPQIQYSSNI